MRSHRLLSILRVVLAGAAALVPAARAATSPAAGAPPHIIVVMAEDMSWAHLGAYGGGAVATPHFDRIAREGARFLHAYAASPSCAPSRATTLTGRQVWELGPGGAMFSFLPAEHPAFPEHLSAHGYRAASTGKGYGPSRVIVPERPHNPAGERFVPAGRDAASLGEYELHWEEFLEEQQRRPEQRFCLWIGPSESHRPFPVGSGVRRGLDPAAVRLPPWLPDTPAVRGDIADYLAAVATFDDLLGQLTAKLASLGLADDTLLVVASDHGWSFPRGKASLYEYGTRVPLVLRWPRRIAAGQVVDAPVGLPDLAPTLLEAAGVAPPRAMSARSFLPLMTGEAGAAAARVGARPHVVGGHERHSPYRPDGHGYPVRAIRTRDFTYLLNLKPDRWPNGAPPHFADPSDPTVVRETIIARRATAEGAAAFALCYALRPAVELYDRRNDPLEVKNVAQDPAYAAIARELRAKLDAFRAETNDPRLYDDNPLWDRE